MPREAALLFGVTEKTLARWARDGRLPYTLTLGGHRRYRRSDLQVLLTAGSVPAQPPPPPA